MKKGGQGGFRPPAAPVANAPLSASGRLPSADLRAHLRRYLPGFMVPSVFVHLDAFPLTPSGKVDRAALPPPGAVPGGGGGGAPRTPAERALAEIWSDLLGVERIERGDDFFALGGHSLLGVRLMARIEREQGRKLPLTALFRCGTLRELAALLEEGRGAETETPLVLLAGAAEGGRPPFFCVHPAGGEVLCYRDLARRLGDERPFYALRARGSDADVERMAAAYRRAIRRVQPRGPYRLGGWSMGGVVAFELARQLAAEGEEIALLALVDSAAPSGDPASTCDEPPAELGADLDPRLRELYRSHMRAMSRYRPRGRLERIVLFRPRRRGTGCLTPGWRDFAGRVEVVEVPGDHFTMIREPRVGKLAERLRMDLKRK